MVEGDPKTLYICTDDGELIVIDPAQPAISWTLTVEAGFGCTSIFYDKDVSQLLYIATVKPSLVAVNLVSKAISKTSLSEKPLHIFRDPVGPISPMNALNVITTKKALIVCHSSCNKCTGVNEADCIADCVGGCATCSNSDPSNCSTCKDGFYIELNQCLPCPSRCHTCTSMRRCLSCKP